MEEKQAKDLLKKYGEGACTDEEKIHVEDWYHQLSGDPVNISQGELKSIKAEILDNLPAAAAPAKKRRLWPVIVSATAAAAVLILLFDYSNEPPPIKPDLAQNILPGSNKAILTLASGKTIPLDTSQQGVKVASGKISYLGSDRTIASPDAGNLKLSTPRGGQYHIILSDGTKVWLNAATTLSYPSSFPKNQRVVRLTGEAYFEVAHNAKSPFIVETSGQRVKVLGTRFNINSYQDEPATVTTLEQGSVLVSLKDNTKQQPPAKLSPGDQSIVSGASMLTRPADLATALAWKNGEMEFRDAQLPAILREVSRWYAIDIDYSRADLSRRFTGSVSRRARLSSVLKILSLSKVPYRLQTTENGTYQLTVDP